MAEPSIADYALIGDTRTAALCSRNGSIDWFCAPRFDSDPLFGRLVGGKAAGTFAITPRHATSTRRRYRDRSAVLETTWRTTSGTGVLTEGMVLELSGHLLPEAVLVRHVVCRQGRMRFDVLYDPRRGLPGSRPRSARRGETLLCSWGALALGLWESRGLDIEPGRERSVELAEGDELTLVLTLADRSPLVLVGGDAARDQLDVTDRWWRRWADDVSYDGGFREALIRSLITLRLLTYSPSGAPVAAPTTSLPEAIGDERNWDYRYSWPRDASIGVAAFLAVGKREEAQAFMHWLLHASRLTRPRLEVLYTIYGKPGPREREIHDVPGYRGSAPVRIGNAASTQHQLDVYGWVVDAAWLLVQAGQQLHGETWRAVSGFADFVARHWREPDAGVWEVRGEPAHYVHSKLMAWLALDRALRISRNQGVSPRRRARWGREKAALEHDVRVRGFSADKNSYVRKYGSDELDAALLLLPVIGLDDDKPERVRGTVNAVGRELDAGDGLLYRYPRGGDDLRGNEGVFLPCSFWLVQALALLGEVEQSAQLFEKLLGHANDVGLFSEELDADSNEALGNFPQAFTHATVVQAALALQESDVGKRPTATEGSR